MCASAKYASQTKDVHLNAKTLKKENRIIFLRLSGQNLEEERGGGAGEVEALVQMHILVILGTVAL